MVMAIPSLAVEGWHGRPGSERRAVGAVAAVLTNHPNSETGRAVVNVQLAGPVDDARRRLMTSSQTERSSAPEAIEDQPDSGGP